MEALESLSKELIFLQPTATLADLERICHRAMNQKYNQVSVPPMLIKNAKEFLAENSVSVSTVIGYPYGWNSIEEKLAGTVLALVDGADEIEVVINMIALKNNDWQYLAKEINNLVTIVRKQGKRVCFMIAATLLDDEELTKCCDLYGVSGVDSINLTTGMEKDLISPNVVSKIRAQLTDAVGLKIYIDQAGDNIESLRLAGITSLGEVVK